VSPQDCEHFRGLIALDAIGQLPEPERAGLGAHTDGCRDCRTEARELQELSEMLPMADISRVDEAEIPRDLSGSVLSRLRAEARRERRTRMLRYTVGGAAAAAIVALSLALAFGGGAATPGAARTMALTGERGVTASVRLTPESWGTSLRIEESGQRVGEVLWVSMRTTSGTWWEAGTYRSVAGRPVQVDLACALGMSDIRSVWVRDSKGHVVLHAYLD